MHHARQHAETRTRERRHRLAHEAARLMAEGGIRDFHQAKLKAAAPPRHPRRRLVAAQPRDRGRAARIPAAVPGRCAGDRPADPARSRTARAGVLRRLRCAAGRSGARRHRRRVFPGGPAALYRRCRCGAALPRRTPASRPNRAAATCAWIASARDDFPVWVFSAEDLAFDLTVLPADALRQAPLSGIDDKPMKRASAPQLRQLLAEQEISGYEQADTARAGLR